MLRPAEVNRTARSTRTTSVSNTIKAQTVTNHKNGNAKYIASQYRVSWKENVLQSYAKLRLQKWVETNSADSGFH